MMLYTGQTIDSTFILDSLLGQSEFGDLYLSRRLEAQEMPLALKIIDVSLISSRLDSIIRFRNETEKLQTLKSPHLANILSTGKWQDTYYIAREYYPGRTLFDTIQKRRKQQSGNFSIDETVRIVLKIARGLSDLHQQGILYHNLKPQNVLLVNDQINAIRLLDTGLSHIKNYSRLCTACEDVSLLSYISPEKTGLLRRNAGPASDLYGLGILFFELLTGKLPFQGKTPEKIIHQHLAVLPPHPSELNPHVPHVLDQILLKLLSKEPDARYQSATGLIEDLEKFLAAPTHESFLIGQNDLASPYNFHIKSIGRDEDLRALKNLYQLLLDEKKSRLAFISARSGMGKTKILTELREMLLLRFEPSYTFQASEASRSLPFAAFTALLKDKLPRLELSVLKKQVSVFFQENQPLLINIFPFLSDFFSFENPKNAPVHNYQREELFTQLEAFFSLIFSDEGKITLLIDDIQWLDPESFSFILFLMNRSSALPWFFALSENTDKSERQYLHLLQDQEIPFSYLELKPLKPEQILLLTQQILQQKELFPPTFYQILEEQTLGVPFHLLELLKKAINAGALSHTDDKWEFSPLIFQQLNEQKDLYTLLLSRIRTLPPTSQKILSFASVIGQSFSLDFLDRLLSSIGLNVSLNQIISALDLGLKEQLLESTSLPLSNDYQFYHDKVKDVFYGFLSAIEVKDAHFKAASLLREKDESDDTLFLITYHYQKSGNSELFQRYNEKAYQLAKKRFALMQAADHLQLSIDFQISQNKITPELAEQILELSNLFQLTTKIRDSLSYLEKALHWAKTNNWQDKTVHILTHIGAGYYLLDNPKESLKHYQEALSLMDAQGESYHEAAPYTFIAYIYYFGYELKEVEFYLSKALPFLASSSLEIKLRTHGLLSWVHALRGKREEALSDLKQLEVLEQELSNPVLLSHYYHYISVCYSFLGTDYQKAHANALLSYENSIKSNYKAYQYAALFSQGFALLGMGEYPQALSFLERGIDFSNQHRIMIGIHNYYGYQALSYFWLGDLEKAQQLSQYYLSDKSKIHGKLAIMLFLLIQAAFQYYQDHLDDCEKTLNEGLTLFQKTDLAMLGVMFMRFSGYLAQKTGNGSRLENANRKLTLLLKERPALLNQKNQADQFIQHLENLKKSNPSLGLDDQFSEEIKEKFQLKNIVQLSQLLSSLQDLDQLLSTIMEKALEITGAERGILMSFDAEKKSWTYEIYHQFKEKDKGVLQESILKKIEATHMGLVFNSPTQEQEFFENKRPKRQQIRSALLSPLIFNKQLTGLLYLDSKLLKNLFTPKDLDILRVFTSQVALILQGAILFTRSQQASNSVQDFTDTPRVHMLCKKYKISDREKDIISLLLKGHKNSQISKLLFISPSTVKVHIYNIYQKIEVKNRIELSNFFKE